MPGDSGHEGTLRHHNKPTERNIIMGQHFRADARDIPACTQVRGKHVRGYFTQGEGGTEFRVMDACKEAFAGYVIECEYTDTFGGEANYCWVRRARLVIPKGASDREIVRRIKAEFGLTGVRCEVDAYGDGWTIKPRGMNTVAFGQVAYEGEEATV